MQSVIKDILGKKKTGTVVREHTIKHLFPNVYAAVLLIIKVISITLNCQFHVHKLFIMKSVKRVKKIK